MKAAVSGRAAAAMVLDGDAWFRIDSDECDVKSAEPHEWPFVFGVAEDVLYMEAKTFEEVRRVLNTAVDENRALTLALICLDMPSEFQTKIASARYLEQILTRTATTIPFLWRVFTAKPLPRDSSIHDAYLASSDQPHLRAFFEKLRGYQPSIARVNEAWQGLSKDAFVDVNSGELRAFAIHEGIWQSIVEAVYEDRAPEVDELVEVPGQWPALRVHQILLTWVDRIAETPARSPVIRFIETPSEVAPAEERTLFAATDVDMEALQSIDFHGALINNLLLGRTIVIPDHYLFTSYGIAEHLLHPNTLLERAIESGLVVVAIRYRGADFETAYDVMRRQRLIPRPCTYVARLQRAADKSPNGAFLYWPVDGMSKTYEQYLSALEADNPPESALKEGGSTLAKDWELTRDWRQSLIAEAREATRRHGGSGVHKRELFRQLVKAVVGRLAPEITGIKGLLHVAKKQSEELEHKVRTFWSWAAEGHRFSRAQMLRASVYSPGYQRVQNLFVTSALGSLTAASNPLRVDVELPSTSTLKSLPPDRIIELRNGVGANYFRAIDRCRSNPDERENVKSALEKYAAEAVSICQPKGGPRIPIKHVELSVGLPTASTDAVAERRQQFLVMTTFNSYPGKYFDQLRPGGKLGGVTINKQTDICITNELPDVSRSV
jgi:hypothetical protein